MSDRHPQKTVVLDDDPTGTQSASDVAVILEWDAALLARALRDDDSVYVLTNTRAMPEDEAVALLARIRAEADEVAAREGYELRYVLRGDSTLRGHVFPESEVFMTEESILVFVPAFPAGGRVTREGRHYVTQGERLVSAHLTEYAQDPVFPFGTSDLREYAAAGSGRPVQWHPAPAEGASDAVARALAAAEPGTVVIFDASSDDELRVLAEGIRRASAEGARIVVRCASPLAAQLAGVESPGLLAEGPAPAGARTLVVCGSHTAGATAQLAALEGALGEPIEIGTDAALSDPEAEGRRVAERAREALRGRGIAVVASARRRLAEHNTLAHGSSVMSALTAAVAGLAGEAALVVSKGGITSADVARVGLGARTATVLGQILPGVSLWLLEDRRGEPVHYVVVPGNVGDERTIAEALGIMGVALGA